MQFFEVLALQKRCKITRCMYECCAAPRSASCLTSDNPAYVTHAQPAAGLALSAL
jgi:hypothetical protein